MFDELIVGFGCEMRQYAFIINFLRWVSLGDNFLRWVSCGDNFLSWVLLGDSCLRWVLLGDSCLRWVSLGDNGITVCAGCLLGKAVLVCHFFNGHIYDQEFWYQDEG